MAFQAHLLGHVLGRGQHAHHRAAIVVQRHLLDFEQHVRASDVAGGELPGQGAVAAHDIHVRGPHRVHVLPAQGQGKIVVVAQVVELGKAEKVQKGPVGTQVAQGLVLPGDELGNVVEHQAQHFLGFAQGALGLVARGHVLDHALDKGQIALAVGHQAHGDVGDNPAGVRPHEPAFEGDRGFVAHGRIEQFLETLATGKEHLDQIAPAAGQDVETGHPEHGKQGRIDVHGTAVRGHAENAQGRVLENTPVLLLGQAQALGRALELGHVVEHADQAGDLPLGAFVHGPVQDDGMGRALGVQDDGLADPHPGLPQKPRVLGGQIARQRRQAHVGLLAGRSRLGGQAAPGAEGRVEALVGPGPILEIEGDGDGVDEGLQEGELVLEFFLHRAPAQDVGHEQDHDVAQDEQAYDDGPEDGDIDVVEGVGLVDEGVALGQLVRGDAEAQHLAEIEDVAVVGVVDGRQGGNRRAVEDLVGQVGYEPAFGHTAVELAADNAVAEHELPGAVDGHVGIGPNGRQHLVDRIDVLLRIFIKRNEEDHGVVGEVAHAVEDFGQGQVVLVFEGQPARKRAFHGLDLVADGHARHRRVAEDDEPAAIRVEAQGQLQGFAHGRVFEHAREVRMSVQPVRVEVVDPAKDHRGFGKQFLAVLAQEIEGEVVRGQDDVEQGVAVFVLVVGVEHLAQIGVRELF